MTRTATRSGLMFPWSLPSRSRLPIDDWFNRVFCEAASALESAADERSAVSLPVNVTESEHELTLEAHVPGFALEDLTITALENEVTIAGSRADAEADENATVIRRERSLKSFERTIGLGTVAIDPDHAAATLRNGVLTLTLPKAEHAKPKRISVTSA